MTKCWEISASASTMYRRNRRLLEALSLINSTQKICSSLFSKPTTKACSIFKSLGSGQTNQGRQSTEWRIEKAGGFRTCATRTGSSSPSSEAVIMYIFNSVCSQITTLTNSKPLSSFFTSFFFDSWLCNRREQNEETGHRQGGFNLCRHDPLLRNERWKRQAGS